MTEPATAPVGWQTWIEHGSVRGDRPPRRVRRALGGWARATTTRLAGPARMLPGLGAAGCAVAGSWLLWSLGVALLVAAALLLLIDARTPRR
jgi:hypothetical protein